MGGRGVFNGVVPRGQDDMDLLGLKEKRANVTPVFVAVSGLPQRPQAAG